MNLFRLDDQVAIVTGSSRGIGAAIASGLAEAGASVLMISRSSPPPELIARLTEIGRPFAYHAADLSRMDAIPGVIDAANTYFGKINILVNNAGIVRRAPFLDHSEADWDDVLNTNLKVPVFLAQACARQMVQQNSGGKIINICSLLSFQGGILVAGYASAKHGLAGATRLMANDLAAHRINVNGIAPGYIRTANTAPLQDDEVRSKAIQDRIPLGRWGESEDLTGAAVFLASRAADYVHGHILVVDGGWMAR